MRQEIQAKEEASPPTPPLPKYWTVPQRSILHCLSTEVYHAYAGETSAAKNGKERINPSGTHQEEDPNDVVILNDNCYREEILQD